MSNETVKMILDDTKEKMQASLDAFEAHLRGMRSGLSCTALVDSMPARSNVKNATITGARLRRGYRVVQCVAGPRVGRPGTRLM